ncbi:MAG: phosphoglycerate dehydrogenase [bacterium]
MKVLISDKLSKKGIDLFQKEEGIEVDVKVGMSPQELISCIGAYDALVVRSETKVTPEVLAAAQNMKVIGRAGSGVDNINLNEASKRGIIVMNTPGGNTITTAEHAISLMLSLVRNIPQATASMKEGKWEKKKFMGIEVTDKILGIIGLGKIGTEVARRARGLAMNVIAYDPYISEEAARKLQVELVDLESIFRKSDIITIHVPKNTETSYMINQETIQKMKDGVRIVNCARGGLVDEKALAEALKSGKVAGAALDVFEKEPPSPDNPLLSFPNVILTPHLGASTEEAQDNVAIAIADQMVDYLKNGTIRNAVNTPSIPQEVLSGIKPFVSLTENMGRLLAQISDGRMEKFTISFHGEVLNYDVAPITVAALMGLLKPILQETVNYVNAPILAKEREITVEEIKDTGIGDFTNLITLTLNTDKGVNTISGTLFGRANPRIVKINGFAVELLLTEKMLVFQNIDKPGVIGDIGGLLGQAGINISGMQFGREKPGGRAISVLNIDNHVDLDMLQKFKELPNVVSVKLITL